MSNTVRPHSLAAYVDEGHSVWDLRRDDVALVDDLVHDLGDLRICLAREEPEDALPLLEALDGTDTSRPYWDQWEIELLVLNDLRNTVRRQLSRLAA